MSHDAFISYSSHDKAAADAASAALEASGVRCWIAPRDIRPGSEWGEAIIDGINKSRALILIFSGSANDSPQISREVERAVHKGIPIIPLRIEDIAPTRSLEYFIGTVHWLDALTPPLEAHLRRLVDSVKVLLQIDPAAPKIVSPHPSPPPRPGPGRGLQAAIAAAIGAVVALAIGLWWFNWAKPQSQPAAAVSTPTPPPALPGASPAKASVDPAAIGTFEHDTVVDDYNWRFVQTVTADGIYHLIMIQEEDGTFHAGNGAYRTVAAKTGRVRTGTYRAVGSNAIEVKSGGATAVFLAADPGAAIDQAHPVMLGTWRATSQQGGWTWTQTIRNKPDGTYHYENRAEDTGTCLFNDRLWRATSAITGQVTSGTYRVIDANQIEIVGASGTTTWRRQQQ
jgi:hypothetical protein